MTSTPYLERLQARLSRGLARLPRAFRERQARYLAASQLPGGGFASRRGPSDLYYTSFALRAAAMLDVAEPDFWKRAAEFLRKDAPPPADPADVLSLLVAAGLLHVRGIALWCESCASERLAELVAVLERFRAAPAGLAKTPSGGPSVYHTFLGALSEELLGEEAGAPEETVRLVLSRERPSGGFADMEGSETPGTNPTAAAVGLLAVLGALDALASERTAEFLVDMQRPDGGFAAHPAAPVSDLLSTFTALVALAELRAVRRARLADAGRFVRSLAVAAGGFRAASADDSSDVEYAFYGLGALALLADELPDESFVTAKVAKVAKEKSRGDEG